MLPKPHSQTLLLVPKPSLVPHEGIVSSSLGSRLHLSSILLFLARFHILLFKLSSLCGSQSITRLEHIFFVLKTMNNQVIKDTYNDHVTSPFSILVMQKPQPLQ